MVRTPQWVQITTGILTVLFAGMLFTAGVFASNTLDGLDFVYDGSQVFPLIVIGIYLAIFLGVDTNINAVVIKVSMIVAVFSGLSFVATTSSDEKYARSFLKPMIERIKHILIIRDIYLGLLTMTKNEVLIPLEEEKSTEKATDKA